jgi:hypothetical protein
MVSILGVADGRLFCGGTSCALAAVAKHEDNRMASAGRRIAESSFGLEYRRRSNGIRDRRAIGCGRLQTAAGTLSKFAALSADIQPF